MTLLDMAGPQPLWRFHGGTYLVWGSRGPGPTDTGAAVVVTDTFDDCPRYGRRVRPGGFGMWDVIRNEAALGFLRRSAATRATSHQCAPAPSSWPSLACWMDTSRDSLGHVSDARDARRRRCRRTRRRRSHPYYRWRRDGRHRLGLTVLAELLGEEAARTTQLMVEYDPAPPFDPGSPSSAGAAVTAAVQATLDSDRLRRAVPAVRAVLERRRASGRDGPRPISLSSFWRDPSGTPTRPCSSLQ